MGGQELGLWFPFNCKSEEGFLPGANNSVHCKVGPPESNTKDIDGMDALAVAVWLNELGLKKILHNKMGRRSKSAWNCPRRGFQYRGQVLRRIGRRQLGDSGGVHPRSI